MPKVPVKEAVKTSFQYFAEILEPSDVRLEEVELSDDERYWFVTLSALLPAKAKAQNAVEAASLAGIFAKSHERVYKQFKVDSSTGEVRSMKIREVEPIGG
jgi:hypothetical protein